MDPHRLDSIASMCGGVLVQGDASETVTRISKDTRTLEPGDLYLALRGENFDGNRFVEAAVKRGAVGAIVDSKPDHALPAGFGLIHVADGLQALQSLATAVRAELPLKVVCITGSNGKTSTKDFCAAVLSERYRVVKTEGNLNNHIGVPLTILSATSADEFAVWEIAMNHRGEIAPLARLAQPDFGIITNIGVAHIEHLGSREAIAEEKGELARAIGSEGVLILSAEDDFTGQLAQRTAGRVVTAGLHGGNVHAENLEAGLTGTRFEIVAQQRRVPARIGMTGEHMVRNALLACALGLENGLSLEECAAGLEGARLTGGRLEQKEIRGIRFLDDSYNANPDSMEAALATLRSLPGHSRRIAVLGRMGELGDYAERGYRRVGTAAASIDVLVAVGPEVKPMIEAAEAAGLRRIIAVADTEAAARWLCDNAVAGDTVLVKGSRAARMERVIGGIA